MANANAVEVARQVGGAIKERRADQEREYWQLVRDVVCEELKDAGTIAEKLASLGRDSEQFVRDVATVNARYDAAELFAEVPAIRKELAEAEAEKGKAFEVFAAAEKVYAEVCDRHFFKARELNGRIATAEAGQHKLIKDNPYPWIREAQRRNGKATLEAERRRSLVNEWLQDAEAWLRADPNSMGAKANKAQAEASAPRHRAELRELDAELARLRKERESIEAELVEP